MNNSWAGIWVLALLVQLPLSAQASLGQARLEATGERPEVTVFYRSTAAEQTVQRGRMQFSLAVDGPPVRGNGRLIVMSHGSGGSPWVHADLARALVEAGFIVAMPWHRADNARDESRPGPTSWALRPTEMSLAIDAVAQDSRFEQLLALDRVGVYGMSAGGHTALSMAGGRWSRAGFRNHCQAHLEADFPACVGLITQLRGNAFDGIKLWVARTALGLIFRDEQLQQHDDPRVAAVVAAVPAAADFEMSSFAAPRVPLGLVIAAQDRWLAPRFHARAVVAACKSCEVIADMPSAGHGSMLSPLPPGITGWEGQLLNDPPGFDRTRMPEIDQLISNFFRRHLLTTMPGAAAKAQAES